MYAQNINQQTMVSFQEHMQITRLFRCAVSRQEINPLTVEHTQLSNANYDRFCQKREK